MLRSLGRGQPYSLFSRRARWAGGLHQERRTGLKTLVSSLKSSERFFFSAATMATTIVLDPFAAKTFVEPGETAKGRAFIEFDKAEFEARINSWYEEQIAAGKDPLRGGYAPFCKHLFVPNFVSGLPDSVLPVNEETMPFLKSGYVSRTDKELPVLARWFPKTAMADRVAEATFLDIILYSREQIRKENQAMGEDSGSDAPWGIVSVKPQSVDSEIPMEPITMLRNALGKEQGGSGVELDRDAYQRSVDFWSKHARVQ
eukprot:TRINITY_DN63056_c0_g1_i1.p1 TRINITY_DN63056_c0_g1~~TRINITY_DN63056_c0_g1_i1.p1  ORF type:complete len:258 (-),score=37.56 TRINITY_DN63056_c0_g1_i1:164-937(-)